MNIQNSAYWIWLVAVNLACGGLATTFAQTNTVSNENDFVNHAIQAAQWIESQQINRDDKTVWPSAPTRSETVSYNLYNGNSGVVLYYLQLHSATGDSKYLDIAKRGANGLLEHVSTLTESSDPGYWTGYTGVGATLAAMHRTTGDDRYRQGYAHCFELLENSSKSHPDSDKGGVHFNSVTDIISGSAGIGFFLLCADEVWKQERALELAVHVGDGLIHVSKPVLLADKTTGLKWTMTPDFPREMPNYSHGTAGVCDFLLALDKRLKTNKFATEYDGRFKNTAISGAKYLVSIADLANDSCLIIHHQAVGENADKEKPLYYLGWCHGPTGTGRLFLNLATHDSKKWNELAVNGGRALLQSGIPSERTAGFWNNVGVCCGSSGVGSYALDLFHVTDDPKFKEFSIRLAHDTRERATQHKLDNDKIGLSWKHAEHRVRPDSVHAQTGLMQGAAGIGMFFLKLNAELSETKFELPIPLHPF